MRAAACLVLFACHPAARPPDAPAPATADAKRWGALASLVGTWEGSDPARHATGRFTLAPELGGTVLVRHNTNDSPEGHHEDLMVIYPMRDGALRASYFDNEGHVIEYTTITSSPTRIALTSETRPDAPRFELVYELKSADELAIDFAIAMPGSPDAKHYTGGLVHRVR